MPARSESTFSALASFDRRVLLKAISMTSAIAAAGGLFAIARSHDALAQDGPTTSAYTWIQAEERGEVNQASIGDFYTIATSAPITYVSANWPGNVGTWPTIEFRFSFDGEEWSSIYYFSADPDSGRATTDNRLHTNIVGTAGATSFQYRVFDSGGTPAPISDLVFSFMDTSDGPAASELAASTDGIPVILSRSEWGANEAYLYDDEGLIWPPEYEPITHLLLHHTETENVGDAAQAVRAIYFNHAFSRGWGDIGYNYLIDRDGRIYEGRSGGANVIGAHAWEYQTSSSGIALIGDYRFSELTSDAQAALIALLMTTGSELDLGGNSDFGTLTNIPTITTHRDLEDTACPGSLLYQELETIRSLASEGLAAADFTESFGVGDSVEVTSIVNLRIDASTSAEIIGELEAGEVATITDGPVDTDGLTWYQLDSALGIGWAAGHYLTQSDAAAETSDTSSGLQTGIVAVINDRANLRSEPSIESEIITTLETGTVVTIIDGPETGDDYTWWQVASDSGTGWVVGDYLESSS